VSSIGRVRGAAVGSLTIMVGVSDAAFGQLEQMATAEVGSVAGAPLR
jgi:3-hydroxyisobutyrate dehydrogenase-like beta-hydroxyacid dehydrogenase